MGLCKCPKKQVTSLFCYEHRVNVCESCVVFSHPSCVIQTYLLWLYNGDYNPNCGICETSLKSGECIRLMCYHVFHWSCFNTKFESMYTNDFSFGEYVCPACRSGIFPSREMGSPIANALRSRYSTVGWGQMIDKNPKNTFHPTANYQKSSPDLQKQSTQSSSPRTIRQPMLELNQISTSYLSPQLSSPKSHFGRNSSRQHSLYTIEEDAEKYRRRNWRFSWSISLSKLMRAARTEKVLLVGFIVIFIVVAVWTLESRASEDPESKVALVLY